MTTSIVQRRLFEAREVIEVPFFQDLGSDDKGYPKLRSSAQLMISETSGGRLG